MLQTKVIIVSWFGERRAAVNGGLRGAGNGREKQKQARHEPLSAEWHSDVLASPRKREICQSLRINYKCIFKEINNP